MRKLKLLSDVYIVTMGTFSKGASVELLDQKGNMLHIRVNGKDFFVNKDKVGEF